MLLVIDAGNTNISFGVFRQERLERSWRVAADLNRTVDEYGVLLLSLFQFAGLDARETRGVVISSVVPLLDDPLERLVRKYFDLEPLFVRPESQSIMPVLYRPPADVGADRIVNAVAAFEKFGGPVIVVDFGTATVFDAISAKGEYLGGVIVPGIRTSADALFTRTAKLPRVEVKRPPRAIGDCTVASIQSGIYFGHLSLVEGILRRMKAELGSAYVVGTGGLATLIASESIGIDSLDENLILHGLRIFYERSRRE